MLFTEPVFVAFFAGVVCLYYLPPLRRFQLPLLLTASFGFYAYGQPYLLLLLVIPALLSAAMSYAVTASATRRAKQGWAFAGVTINLAILGFFKYGGLIEHSLFGANFSAGGVLGLLLALP